MMQMSFYIIPASLSSFSHPSSPSSHHACLPHINQPWSSDFRMLQVHLWLSHWIRLADNTLKSATLRLKPPTSRLKLHALIPLMDVSDLSIWGIVWYNSATLYDSLFPSEKIHSGFWLGLSRCVCELETKVLSRKGEVKLQLWVRD